MADKPKGGAPQGDIVGVPKQELEQLVAMAQAYQQMQQGGAPKGGEAKSAPPKKEEKKKREPITFESLENKMIEYGYRTDAFFGSTARSAATTYSAGLALPFMVSNPVLALGYGAAMALTGYVSSNVLWKLGRNTVSMTYNLARHPINSIKGAVGAILSYIPGITFIQKLASKINLKPAEEKKVKLPDGVKVNDPKGLTGFFFTPHTESQTGSTLGKILGAGLALKTLSPELFEKTIGKVFGYVIPGAENAYEGAKMAAEKTYGLGEAVLGAGKNYYISNIQPGF